jgi:hypothetical protein
VTNIYLIYFCKCFFRKYLSGTIASGPFEISFSYHFSFSYLLPFL